MDQRGAGEEPGRRRGGAVDRYGNPYDGYDHDYDQDYSRSRGARTASGSGSVAGASARSSKGGKSKALMATSIALVVFAAGATAVVASGVLKKKDKPAAASTPAADTAPGAAQSASGQPAAAPSAASALYSDQVPTVSDGTDVVRINHREVKFPSAVTGAVWSPNGTRLAYIDGDGNVATALPDGTDVRVVTKKKAGIERANVAWNGLGTQLYWDSRTGKGRWLIANAAVGAAPAVESGLGTWAASEDDKSPNSQYTAAAARFDALGTTPDTPDAFRIGDTIYEDAYVRSGLDPDNNGYGGWGWVEVDKGSDPAIAPDGRIAYIGANGQVWTATQSEGVRAKPVQLTFGADHPAHPAWSPDGTRVAFSTKTDVESVSAAVQPGATANPARQEDPKPGVPSYQRTGLAPAVLAFSQADPVATAVTLSQTGWTDYRSAYKTATPSTEGALLVPADAPEKVMTAAALYATSAGIPLYPVAGGTLDPRVVAELTRLFGHHDKRKFIVEYAGAAVPSGIASAVTAATGSAPLAVDTSDPDGFGLMAEKAFNQQRQKNQGSPGDDAALDPAALTFVVADDDRPSLLVALGAAQSVPHRDGAPVDERIVLTKGATMPDSGKQVLNGTQSPVVAIGAHAVTAVSAGWSGKPALKVTKFTGATPAALADAVAKSLPALEKAAPGSALTATLLPPPTDAAWTDELLIAATNPGLVLFTGPAAAPGAETQTYLKQNLAALIHVDTLGDGTALAANLSKALDTPLPFPVLQDPKAPATSGN